MLDHKVKKNHPKIGMIPNSTMWETRLKRKLKTLLVVF